MTMMMILPTVGGRGPCANSDQLTQQYCFLLFDYIVRPSAQRSLESLVRPLHR